MEKKNNNKEHEVNLMSSLDLKFLDDKKYDEHKIKHNQNSLILSKQFYGIISGITVGILGIQGIYGFLFFFLFTIIGTLMTYFHIKSNFNSFFLKKSDVLYGDIFSGLISFILFWTLTYDILYIF
ncbi:ER membrane protein complex subunit 6, putative [Plasmodium relictum]|uniref:ER membrane protein complex subunit 6 n=1 Tax=Plasmodium relictum TaxID=85471 RepID=A0A1J1HFD5_PLARL|nr:ER membrane protein complex subunit 6, putative [Plasmodium relictum]CRH02573.1 ER membrane protein complex subunit 6, putative [Plasmodium relictum]